MRRSVIVFAVLSAAIFGPVIGAQAKKLGPEFRADTTTNGHQTNPSVAGLKKKGQYVAVWTSTYDGFGSGVFGRRYSAKGKPKSEDEFLINTTTKEDQYDASVAALAKGGFVVVWTSSHKLKSLSDVFARRYDDRGNPLGKEFRVNTRKKSHQQKARVAGLKNGSFVVIWQSYDQDGDGYGVYGQRYNRKGEERGKEFQVNKTTESLQGMADVAALSDGGFAVVWESQGGQDGDGTGVYGQRLDAKGKRKGKEFRVNNTTAGSQRTPSVTGLANGGFIVAWGSANLDGSETGVAARRYKASGKAKGKEFIVNKYKKLGQTNPSVAALAKGGYVVSWESEDQDEVDGQNIDLSGIYGQRFKDNGTKVGKEIQIPTFLAGRQRNSAVTGIGEGRRFVVFWESDGQDYGGFNIYGQRLK